MTTEFELLSFLYSYINVLYQIFYLFYSTFVSCATTHIIGNSFQVTTVIKGCRLFDGLLFIFINILMNLFAVEQFLTSAKVI